MINRVYFKIQFFEIQNMDNLIRQRRVSFAEHGLHYNEDSFKDKKSWNSFQRPLYMANDDGYESIDGEFVAAVAAATFAVHSYEETSPQHLSTMKRREEAKAAMRNRMSQAERAPSFGTPTGEISLTIQGGNTKIDAWEKAQLQKIQKRYEKSNLKILGWENEKKSRARHQVEEKKKELEGRSANNWQNYQNKLARIDHIAGGARAQTEEKKSYNEYKVKEKAKKMRSLGMSSPKYCFCC